VGGGPGPRFCGVGKRDGWRSVWDGVRMRRTGEQGYVWGVVGEGESWRSCSLISCELDEAQRNDICRDAHFSTLVAGNNDTCRHMNIWPFGYRMLLSAKILEICCYIVHRAWAPVYTRNRRLAWCGKAAESQWCDRIYCPSTNVTCNHISLMEIPYKSLGT
jgi:hypothetical protein